MASADKYKPGIGWRRLSGAVYEREDGLRVHLLGLCKLVDGTLIQANTIQEIRDQYMFISINGGNTRRGLMAWANKKQFRSENQCSANYAE